ncbi:uncharacterized protein FIBRA_06825 [Fibroporia radiculosa]|uniref:Uncharacterized protein n=1 Tax=Fibroporia radiculosa TaxID=599839 RepID=J4IBG9_9APHY|nr:uncharacterized protein FIBRA_06825 [Fibroporia radiculosa]CCM04641.1 predicted protein [Fibroporia radiculosa]
MHTTDKSRQLRSLIRLLTDAAEVVIREWDAPKVAPLNIGSQLPSQDMFEARRIILGACGMCADLVQDPLSRLSEITCGYIPARALHIAAQACLFDLLASADPVEGISIHEISCRTGINESKLVRILRCLCSIHVFAEVKLNHFTNTPTSAAVVGNEPFRSWILIGGAETFAASYKLPAIIMDPVKTHSLSHRESALQEVLDTKLTLWEYLETGVSQEDGTIGPRPELRTWSLAMIGGAQMNGPPLLCDFPWEKHNGCTIVDVGAGVGSMSLELAKIMPITRFHVQDRGAVIQDARAIWMRELPEAIGSNRVNLMAHDFFTEQPIKGADIYLLRYILHDWPDKDCITILKLLRDAMARNSCLLVADYLLNTTIGSSRLKSAPHPLPANYGVAQIFSNMHDLSMMSLFNGMERSPNELEDLGRQAGLEVVRIWECRGYMSIVEFRRDLD